MAAPPQLVPDQTAGAAAAIARPGQALARAAGRRRAAPGLRRGYMTWDGVLDRVPNRDWRRWATTMARHARRAHQRRVPGRPPGAPLVLVGDLSRPQGGCSTAATAAWVTPRTRTAWTSTSTTRGATACRWPRCARGRSIGAWRRTSSTASSRPAPQKVFVGPRARPARPAPRRPARSCTTTTTSTPASANPATAERRQPRDRERRQHTSCPRRAASAERRSHSPSARRTVDHAT